MVSRMGVRAGVIPLLFAIAMGVLPPAPAGVPIALPGVATTFGVAASILRGVTPLKSEGWSGVLSPPFSGVCVFVRARSCKERKDNLC